MRFPRREASWSAAVLCRFLCKLPTFISTLLASSALAESASRVIQPFDADWRFTLDDRRGAESPAFQDGTWRKLDVPHDWSIEGPCDEKNPTDGGGGFLPAGIGWYRKQIT